jgi:hypothetical protein
MRRHIIIQRNLTNKTPLADKPDAAQGSAAADSSMDYASSANSMLHVLQWLMVVAILRHCDIIHLCKERIIV